MNTLVDDDDLLIPEIETSGPWRPNRFAKVPGEGTEIRIDGATGYTLRLIPSNKVLARFESTLEAWPAIIAAVESGRSPRTLSLDWNGANGRGGRISAGPRLERWARHNNGEPIEYVRPRARSTGRRVAESR